MDQTKILNIAKKINDKVEAFSNIDAEIAINVTSADTIQ